ncbi:MAG TPA: dephospho-CoA kinase [Vicinamibacterales bacterium]|nr:dephospho-CoA kinase [Vicinamibacterales bacterium]
MLRVAITGGIGTGKSVVLAELASCGAPIVDADALVHEALGAGMPAASAVRERFGETVISATGDVDRARLGAIVFQDERARQDLEAILHPAVYRAIEAWMRAQERGGAIVAVAEIPLLFETGHESDFDCVVVTACEGDEQVRRAAGRSGVTEADIRRRIAAQWPLAEKIRRADIVVRTDGTIEETRRQARAVWDALTRRATVGYSRD